MKITVKLANKQTMTLGRDEMVRIDRVPGFCRVGDLNVGDEIVYCYPTGQTDFTEVKSLHDGDPLHEALAYLAETYADAKPLIGDGGRERCLKQAIEALIKEGVPS